jgi:hypothetical protein
MFVAVFGRYPYTEQIILVVIPLGASLPADFTAVRVVAIARTLPEAIMLTAGLE